MLIMSLKDILLHSHNFNSINVIIRPIISETQLASFKYIHATNVKFKTISVFIDCKYREI